MRLILGGLLLVASSVVAAAPATKCVIEEPEAPVASPAKAAPCQRVKPVTAALVRAAITKRFKLQHEGSTLDVPFACDDIGPKVTEIVVESGSGHGGGLAMWRAVRQGDGTYEVRGIRYTDRGTAAYVLVGGSVAVPALPTARAGLAARPREVKPPPKPNTISLGRYSSSSRDFHAVVRMTDTEGRTTERRFTGYASSGDQDTYLGIEIAMDALSPITSVAATSADPAPEARELFAARFVAAVPYFDTKYAWWVMERYVGLAQFLGTPRTIAGLLTRLTVTTPDRSKLDARADAVAALAHITGWDAREGGRTVEEAAARYLAECRKP